MKKSLMLIAGIFSAVALLTSSASAAPAGQIEGGDIYRVRNVSTNGSFTDPASGSCGQTFQFKVRIHNPGPDALQGVTVKATLPAAQATSHSSHVTMTASNANPSTTTDTAGINLDKAAKLNYITGSTELLDANGSKIQTLGNSILTSGVTIGTVGVSTQQQRFVQFSVKSECPTPPTPKPEPKKIEVCELKDKKIVTINEKDFDSNKHSKDLNDCKIEEPNKVKVCEKETKKIITIDEKDFDENAHTKDLNACAAEPTPEIPAELPKTGVADALSAFAGLGLLVASAGYYINSRRLLG